MSIKSALSLHFIQLVQKSTTPTSCQTDARFLLDRSAVLLEERRQQRQRAGAQRVAKTRHVRQLLRIDFDPRDGEEERTVDAGGERNRTSDIRGTWKFWRVQRKNNEGG